MSDFGAIISIRKTDGGNFSQEESDGFVPICEQLKSENNMINSMGERYLFTLGTTKNIQGEIRGVNILLSDYWGDKDDFIWHQEVDEKDARLIADELITLIGDPAYQVSGTFELW